MTWEVYRDKTQLAQYIVILITTPAAIAVTGFRFHATRRGKRKINIEDWMALVAAIFAVLTNLFELLCATVDNGRPIDELLKESPKDFMTMRKLEIVCFYLYFGFLLTVKLSILALYRRIFGVNVTYRRWIYGIGIFQCVCFVMYCFLLGFSCIPLRKFWDFTAPGHCIKPDIIIVVGSTLDSVVDFSLVILAMIMIKQLQLSSTSKTKLRALFGVGIVVGIIGFIRTGIVYSPDALYAYNTSAIWTSVQMLLALICACMPVYAPILPKGTVLSRYYAMITSRTSRSKDSIARSGRSGNSRDGDSIYAKKSNDDWASESQTGNSYQINVLATSSKPDQEHNGIRVDTEYNIHERDLK